MGLTLGSLPLLKFLGTAAQQVQGQVMVTRTLLSMIPSAMA